MNRESWIGVILAALGGSGMWTTLSERRKIKSQEPAAKADTADRLVSLVREELEHYVVELHEARSERDDLREQLRVALLKIDQLHFEVVRLTAMVKALGGDV